MPDNKIRGSMFRRGMTFGGRQIRPGIGASPLVPEEDQFSGQFSLNPQETENKRKEFFRQRAVAERQAVSQGLAASPPVQAEAPSPLAAPQAAPTPGPGGWMFEGREQDQGQGMPVVGEGVDSSPMSPTPTTDPADRIAGQAAKIEAMVEESRRRRESTPAPEPNLYEFPDAEQRAYDNNMSVLGQRRAAIEGGMPPSVDQLAEIQEKQMQQAQYDPTGLRGRYGEGSPLTYQPRTDIPPDQTAAMVPGVVTDRFGRSLAGGPLQYAEGEGNAIDRAQAQAQAEQRAEMYQRGQDMLQDQYQGGGPAPGVSVNQYGEYALSNRTRGIGEDEDPGPASPLVGARWKVDPARVDRIKERRAAEKARFAANRQALALRRAGVSPLSAEGQALAPELFQQLQEQRQKFREGAAGSAGSAGNVEALKKNGQLADPEVGRTAENVQKAESAAVALVQSSSFFASLGFEMEDGAGYDAMPSGDDIASAFTGRVINGDMDVSAADLTEMWTVLSQMQVREGEDSIFSKTDSPLERDDTKAGRRVFQKFLEADTPEKREKWYSEFKTSQSAMKEEVQQERAARGTEMQNERERLEREGYPTGRPVPYQPKM
jgi:hypothetical protein